MIDIISIPIPIAYAAGLVGLLDRYHADGRLDDKDPSIFQAIGGARDTLEDLYKNDPEQSVNNMATWNPHLSEAFTLLLFLIGIINGERRRGQQAFKNFDISPVAHNIVDALLNDKSAEKFGFREAIEKAAPEFMKEHEENFDPLQELEIWFQNPENN